MVNLKAIRSNTMSQNLLLDHTQGQRAFLLFGDRGEPTTTREKLVEVAIDRFYVQGFHAVGLDQILAEVGVTKTTFYNHFESKDDLIIEALERREHWETKAFLDRAMQLGGGDPKATLVAMFDVLDEWFNHPDFHGCLFLNACIEYPASNDPVHRVGAKHYEIAVEQIRTLAAQAGAADPVLLADQLVVLFQGTLTHRHVASDNLAAEKARKVAEALVEHSLATSG